MDIKTYATRRIRHAVRDADRPDNPFGVALESLREDALAAGHDRLCSFAHYDYLGLAKDRRISDAAIEAIESVGVGVGASRLVGGERQLHGELEAELAGFLGAEAALVLVSGYGANASLIGHFTGKRDLILIDELSHNSLFAGAEMSRSDVVVFRHNDLQHLEELLSARRGGVHSALIVTEGLFSMDGDAPDLVKLIEIKDRHNAWLLLDEAHSIGVMGATGRGLPEECGIDPARIEIRTGTLSKAFTSCGGFIAASREVIRSLRYTLPAMVYSVGMTPPATAAALTALRILEAEPWRVQQQRENSRHFLKRLSQDGFNVGTAQGYGVIPVILPSQTAAFETYHQLLSDGYYVPPIVQLGIPRDLPRLRFFLTAAHTPEQIDGVCASLQRAGRIRAQTAPAKVA